MLAMMKMFNDDVAYSSTSHTAPIGDFSASCILSRWITAISAAIGTISEIVIRLPPMVGGVSVDSVCFSGCLLLGRWAAAADVSFTWKYRTISR
jgi:hypothetical protein